MSHERGESVGFRAVMIAAAAIFIFYFIYTILLVLLQLSQPKLSSFDEKYDYLTNNGRDRYDAVRVHSAVKDRRKKPSYETVISLHNVLGNKVNAKIASENVIDRTTQETYEYSRERLPPLSQSSMLRPGSEEEIVIRKTHAIRFRKIVDPHDYSFIIDPLGLCSQEPPDTIIAVTIPSRLAQVRQNFREHMWGGFGRSFNQAEKVVLLFFFGVPEKSSNSHTLRKESERYGDIVQASYPDTGIPPNGSIKTVSALRWISSRCPKAKFVIMATETCLINVPLMLTELRLRRALTPLFILGKASWPTRPRSAHASGEGNDDQTGEGREEDVPSQASRGLQYLSRGCLGFPMSVARLLYEAALRVPLLNRDNVFLTGVCAGLLNIARYDNQAFYFAPANKIMVSEKTVQPMNTTTVFKTLF